MTKNFSLRAIVVQAGLMDTPGMNTPKGGGMEQTQVDQVGKLLERLRNPGHALTATGGLRQRRLLDNLRIVSSEKQEEEFKVPEATWD